MHKPALSVIGVIALCALGACALEEEPRTAPANVDSSVALASTRTMAEGIARATRGQDVAGGTTAILAGAIQSQGVVATAFSLRSSGALQTLGTCLCTTGVCSYVDCAPQGTTGVIVNGSVSVEGGSLRCSALTYEAIVQGTRTTVVVDCDVDVTDTSMKGTVRVTGASTLGTLVQSERVALDNVTWSATTTLVDIVHDGFGPTSGTARVDASVVIGAETYVGVANVAIR